MAKILYCWRCKADMPMLDEHEWEQVRPHLRITEVVVSKASTCGWVQER